MPYTAKDYNALIGMEGFSETLIKNHFTLYQGYVTNTNKVSEILDRDTGIRRTQEKVRVGIRWYEAARILF